MTVEALNIFFKDFKKKPYAKSITLIENKGVVDDKSFGSGKRQISLMFSDVKDWVDNTEPRGLCFSRFKGNIVIDRNGDEYAPAVGDELIIGECVIRLTEVGKGCFSECEREQKGLECRLRELVMFGEVLKGGEIKSEMKICLKQ